ncbi:MAG: TIGR03792 family protein [Elainellaceae cyanobacterium]
MMSSKGEQTMVIEWLQFRVAEDQRERFVQLDSEIWTPALARQDGFLGKDVWISAEQLEEVIAVIRWSSSEAWHSIPADELEQVDQQFSTAMGSANYELLDSREYQVRKFSSPC